MTNLDQIFNKALEMLEKGRSKEEVLLEFSEFKAELEPLLEISTALLLMPKNSAPEPAMRRKYMAAPAKSMWLAWVHISKFSAVSMSIMLLVSALTVAGYSAVNSHPGQSLFAVKKSAEQLELLLAASQNKKADLQIAIAQKRLSEAQEIFNNPNSGSEQKNAALNELAAQTSSAVSQVDKVAKSDLKSTANNPLLNSLTNIAKQQQTLLAEIKPEDKTAGSAAASAQESLGKNTAKISEIKESVAVAASESAITSLSGDPNAVGVLGVISQLSKDQLTVEKTVFTVNDKTVIKNNDGNTVAFSNLTTKMKISVSGTKNSKGILAENILIVSSLDLQNLIKDLSTTTTESLSKQTDDNTTVTSLKTSATSTNTDPKDPNAALGSFILEDPAPQFVR